MVKIIYFILYDKVDDFNFFVVVNRQNFFLSMGELLILKELDW